MRYDEAQHRCGRLLPARRRAVPALCRCHGRPRPVRGAQPTAVAPGNRPGRSGDHAGFRLARGGRRGQHGGRWCRRRRHLVTPDPAGDLQLGGLDRPAVPADRLVGRGPDESIRAGLSESRGDIRAGVTGPGQIRVCQPGPVQRLQPDPHDRRRSPDQATDQQRRVRDAARRHLDHRGYGRAESSRP